MHRWNVSTVHSRETGEADTFVHAWQAAHVAAMGIVRCGDQRLLTLQVDGQHTTLRPAETGDPSAAIAASLQRIDAGRRATGTPRPTASEGDTGNEVTAP